jgi:hypothetical protein
MVIGGPSLEMDYVINAVERISRLAAKVRDPLHDGQTLALDVVFDIPGPIVVPPYKGLRTGRFSRDQRKLQIQVAVPEDLKREATEVFLDGVLRQSVELAQRSLQRRKLDWSVEPLRSTVEEIIAMRRSGA